ncbi:uncharacterized protein SETTUDRAFT_35226 [Exserohilum turcica Et28A]|uniref:Uncharacterized protein n=1 Tax=Exserohilum turcicum (strain 28A) TaxID=671987 RepID=R0I735_EXST2|nr:uncharacterized protein SETTUDRAFT_35226 [Exserohilum turcica Et28A]EOA81385.1 hypothetical protein SETTUDRAFT_35226 [Exserohilum turcica Et28A]
MTIPTLIARPDQSPHAEVKSYGSGQLSRPVKQSELEHPGHEANELASLSTRSIDRSWQLYIAAVFGSLARAANLVNSFTNPITYELSVPALNQLLGQVNHHLTRRLTLQVRFIAIFIAIRHFNRCLNRNFCRNRNICVCSKARSITNGSTILTTMLITKVECFRKSSGEVISTR